MKNLIKVISLVFLITFFSNGFSQSYIDHEDFSITFPIEPIQSEQDVPTQQGTFKMQSYMTDGVDAIYVLSYIDYTETYFDAYNTDDFFLETMNSFTTSLGISSVEQRNTSISGHPGHYYKASGGSYYCIKYDYIVKNRFYQVGILRTDRYPTDYEISTYFDSFKLKSGVTDEIKRPEPISE